jgi:DNA-binding MarR family transcriptional regulator
MYEPITGTINIQNSNLHLVTFNNNTIFHEVPGEHFSIQQNKTYKAFHGISNNFQYLFPIIIDGNNGYNFNFIIDNFTELYHSSDKKFISYLLPGNYSINCFFYFGDINEFEMIKSNVTYFEVFGENESVNVTPGSKNETNKTKVSSSNYLFIGSASIFTITAILTITLFITFTEVGKYGFFSVIGPLYSKPRKKKDENYGYIKGLVHGYIDGNPGENYSKIKKSLKLNNGTLAYYLKILEREGSVFSERDGFLKRFYPSQGRVGAEIIELTELQKRILNIIKEKPGISQKNIQERLGITQQRLNYQIKQMKNARLIKVDRDGKKTKCYLIE